MIGSGSASSPGPVACPNCGAAHQPDALFCEECAFDFTGGRATSELAANGALPRRPTGDAAPVRVTPPAPADGARCSRCGNGSYADGYCDQCGAKQRAARDHEVQTPQSWVAGVCDIGLRHHRNEDAMALHADPEQLSFAALVICDGVSNSTDSHLASLAASHAARDVLSRPIPRGMGTRTGVVSAMARRLDESVQAAQRAVVSSSAQDGVNGPPSCTVVAMLIDHGVAVVANVGDSRAYWIPDDPAAHPLQLSTDDSWAHEQVRAGMDRAEAEAGARAHAITRWLGVDSPQDLAPHIADLDLDQDGWLLAASDGLWNYCSDAGEMSSLVRSTVTRLGPAGRHPASLAQALTEYAIACGGRDNITVALARAGPLDPAPSPPSDPASTPPSRGASPRGEPRHGAESSYSVAPGPGDPEPSPSETDPDKDTR